MATGSATSWPQSTPFVPTCGCGGPSGDQVHRRGAGLRVAGDALQLLVDDADRPLRTPDVNFQFVRSLGDLVLRWRDAFQLVLRLFECRRVLVRLATRPDEVQRLRVRALRLVRRPSP